MTTPEPTPERLQFLRQYIAEKCGWTNIGPCTCGNCVLHGNQNPEWPNQWSHIPDYPGSLDSMAQAEKTLSAEPDSDVVNKSYYSQQMRYSVELWEIVEPDAPKRAESQARSFAIINASAYQRAEAFYLATGGVE